MLVMPAQAGIQGKAEETAQFIKLFSANRILAALF